MGKKIPFQLFPVSVYLKNDFLNSDANSHLLYLFINLTMDTWKEMDGKLKVIQVGANLSQYLYLHEKMVIGKDLFTLFGEM